MRRHASGHDGGSTASWTQWAKEASSHHSARRDMTLRCAPDSMKERMALSSLHTVRVQKARLASRRMETARLPAASSAWRATRKEWITNRGRYRQDRTRSRVMDTKGISLWSRVSEPPILPLAAALPWLLEKIEAELPTAQAACHVRRSCDLSSLSSSAAHSRASAIFPASQKARAFAKAWLSADRSAADSLPDCSGEAKTPRASIGADCPLAVRPAGMSTPRVCVPFSVPEMPDPVVNE
jgi:hypothetical protein